MTEKELAKLIENKYGTYPDNLPGVAARSRFSESEWNKYCQLTTDLLNSNLSDKEFFNRFLVLPIWCGASTPPDE